jgi:hypothetical protein
MPQSRYKGSKADGIGTSEAQRQGECACGTKGWNSVKGDYRGQVVPGEEGKKYELNPQCM